MRSLAATLLCPLLAFSAPVATAPVSGTAPAPVEAWRAARFGMTPDEVLAAFPKEAPVAPPR